MGSFSTVTAPQNLISAGAHCWSPAASSQSAGKIATIWWPPSAPQQPAHGVPKEADVTNLEGSADSPGYSSEILKIMTKVKPEQDKVGKLPTTGSKGGEAELETVRDWTIAEQLRHPYPIVSLQWSPCNLQRGLPNSELMLCPTYSIHSP